MDIGAFEATQNYFLVTNTDDSGPGSLRQALLDADAAPNLAGGPNVIQFGIPGSGVQTITPESPLPAITTPVDIDGYSQPGASPNTATTGDNANLLIQLDGAAAGASALDLEVGNSTVTGLIIDQWAGAGILVDSSNNTIVGNFIGTDAAGTAAGPGNGTGIFIDGSDGPAVNNIIGGPGLPDFNLISGNSDNGVQITGIGAVGNVVEGDFIGTDATQVNDLGNANDGVRIDNGASDSLITNDHIDFNDEGVVVAGNNTTGNSILNNPIFGNTGLGIDLGDDGITPNGTAPPGPNDFQNHPVLTAATSSTVSGYLLGAANTNYDIQLFVSPASGPAEQGDNCCKI